MKSDCQNTIFFISKDKRFRKSVIIKTAMSYWNNPLSRWIIVHSAVEQIKGFYEVYDIFRTTKTGPKSFFGKKVVFKTSVLNDCSGVRKCIL